MHYHLQYILLHMYKRLRCLGSWMLHVYHKNNYILNLRTWFFFVFLLMIAQRFIIGYKYQHSVEPGAKKWKLWVCYSMHALTSGAPFIQKNEKICGFSMPWHVPWFCLLLPASNRDQPYITSPKGLGGWGQNSGQFCWRSVLFMLM